MVTSSFFLGDVAGHDARSAGVAREIDARLSGLSDVRRPGALLSILNGALATGPADLFVTAICFSLDPLNGEGSIATAGQLPPILKSSPSSSPIDVAVTFAGQPAQYRLMAHVAGDPENEIYCLQGYQSGQVVDAGQLKAKCWTGAGAPLGGFQNVDKIGLQILSTRAPISFDVCVSDILVR